VRKSPRPEIQAVKRDILRFMREHGILVGPSFDRLIDIVSFAPERLRNDAAIALAAGPHVLLTLDSWQAQFRLSMGGRAIYLDPHLFKQG